MAEFVRCSLRQLPGLVRRKVAAFAARCDAAVEQMPQAAVPIIRRRTPKAFGDLSNSVHAEPGKTVVNAPHAGAVEQGSMPHTPDFEALLAWVKLRGMQGLNDSGSIRRVYKSTQGPTTPQQAMSVAEMLKQFEVRGKAGGAGRHTPVGAAEEVARAIASAIEKEGTRPHWFVRNSLEEIGALLKTKLLRAKGRYGGQGKATNRRVIKVIDT